MIEDVVRGPDPARRVGQAHPALVHHPAISFVFRLYRGDAYSVGVRVAEEPVAAHALTGSRSRTRERMTDDEFLDLVVSRMIDNGRFSAGRPATPESIVPMVLESLIELAGDARSSPWT